MTGSHRFVTHLQSIDPVRRVGRVRRILPTHVEADGPFVPLGALCRIGDRPDRTTLAQVAAVHEGKVVLVPFDSGIATSSGARVEACSRPLTVDVGEAFLGRAVDALGRPIDGGDDIVGADSVPLHRPPSAPLQRLSPTVPLDTGIRAIDTLLTLGKGQRVGLFAASGVGKTSLMTQVVQQADFDRCVICLVGERGREVQSLWSETLHARARERAILVAATSDQSAAMRVRACDYALALAEHWRAQGHHVLLLIDSMTRLAMALREIGLAAGEPPTVRAYTPSVFSTIPKIVERCGALKGAGSVTAIMTVLCETDDTDDPIAEMMKSLIDGHIILSRALAERAHFPPIDVPRSVSRLAPTLVPRDERRRAERAIGHLSTLEAARLMIEAGAYISGSNAEIDAALAARGTLTKFLRQAMNERTSRLDAHAALSAALGDAA
jgi:flagellum-specific ATP synthase